MASDDEEMRKMKNGESWKRICVSPSLCQNQYWSSTSVHSAMENFGLILGGCMLSLQHACVWYHSLSAKIIVAKGTICSVHLHLLQDHM